ncbi:2,4-dihydroxyhept-2-ene-1,7-dioic acid aldolase [Tremella mesenterica]|uniref:2,4-dihydroxyhept-2-ene-1,7-dioic acid aldolase n=1 Tax=Tremella mesenterica TaxID=5217 RepID=A0A4Q1BIJ7_TREME|nr:2,4-dihydroxyhept-2-ene-1,7-dioic acid aldolase [Tremella mesenterica]
MENALYLRNKLAKGEKALGFWLTFPSTGLARTILATGGLSWTLLDAEHGQITDKDYFDLCNAVVASKASPIIRIPFDVEWMIKRALDAGAHGVMTPLCHTADDARRIVKYSKYPPTGTRGFGPMFSPHSFGLTTEGAYAAGADKGLLVIVQIESVPGVENVEEIAKVDGVDVIFIGPFDLSKFLGCEFGGEVHEAAIAKILKAAKAAGKTAAIFCTSGEMARKRLDQGFDMVSITTDIGAVQNGFSKEFAITTATQAGPARSGY